MKKYCLIVVIALSALFLLYHHADAQIRQVLALGDFLYEGELWPEELGAFIADKLIARLRLDGNYFFVYREESNKILHDYGIESAYGSSLKDLSMAFRAKGVHYLLAGRINGISQIEERPGRVNLKISVDLQIIDPRLPYIITTERAERSVILKDKIAPDAAFDPKIADKLTSGVVRRLRLRINSILNSTNQFQQ